MYTRAFNLKDLTVPVAATMAAALGIGVAAPSSSFAQADRQKDKNMMRNIAIGAAAGAIYSGVKGNKTAAVVLGAGALYAGKKYEDARKAQAKESAPQRYGYDYPRYEDSRYRTDGSRNGNYRNSGGRYGREDISYANPRASKDNGKHKGWHKNKHKKQCD